MKTIVPMGFLGLYCAMLSTSAPASPGINAHLIAYTCTSCHGPDGKSKGAIPSLQAMSQQEIKTACEAFRSGERKGVVMNQIIGGYSTEEIEAVAALFSAQQKGED